MGSAFTAMGRLVALVLLLVALAVGVTACGGDGGGTEGYGRLSVAEARKATQDHPKDPEAWRALAFALQDKGRTAAAIPAAQRLITLKPKDIDGYRQLGVLYLAQGRAYQQKAQNAKAQESFDKAVESYARLVRVVPKDQHVRIELGQAAEQAGDKATAVAAYQAFLRLTPKDPNAPYVRKWLKRLKGS